MYQKDEIFEHEEGTHARIVLIGINESDGRLKGRLKDYGKYDSTPLYRHVHQALNARRGEVSAWDVKSFILQNFRYRLVPLPSADAAKHWEKKIIPTVARYSRQFTSEGWLGRRANLQYGIWDIQYAGAEHWWRGFDDEDMREFSTLINAEQR